MTTATTWRSPVDFTFHLEVHQYNWPILVDSRCKFTFNLRQLTVIDLISFHPTLINLLTTGNSAAPTACLCRLGAQDNGARSLHGAIHMNPRIA